MGDIEISGGEKHGNVTLRDVFQQLSGWEVRQRALTEAEAE
jgi:hypothetical protein